MTKNKYGDFRRTIPFPVFSGYKMYVVFTDDIARSKKHRYGNDDFCDNADALHIPNVGGTAHIFFKYDADPRIIAHECWHAIRGMLLWAGANAELDNEVVAYHLGYLVGKVHKFLEAVTKILAVKSNKR